MNAEVLSQKNQARNKAALAIEEEIATLQRNLKSAQERLERAHTHCQHDFGGPIYTPQVFEAYFQQGDLPGFGGVDRRGDMWVPERVTKEWSRVCKLCGHVETTRLTKKQYVNGPVAGTGGEIEVPWFG